MLRLPPGAPGAVAQSGERLLCKQEVVGSIPIGSTKFGAGLPGARGNGIGWRMGFRNSDRRGDRPPVRFTDIVNQVVKLAAPVPSARFPRRDSRESRIEGAGCDRIMWRADLLRGAWPTVPGSSGQPAATAFSPACDGFPIEQAQEGRLADALALRGDEGRGTLR